MPAVSPFVLLATAMAFAMAPGARAATPAGAVASPDGARAVAVETRAPVSYGDSTDFATRLVVRVDDTGPTASAGGMRRVVEASQVRSVGAPVWLGADSPWTGFTYDIQKNSSGLVYLDTSSGRGVQLEWVAPARRMAATGKIEADLTSLEVQELAGPMAPGAVPLGRVTNIVRGRGSVFPLALKPLPPAAGAEPYPKEFLDGVLSAMESYRGFLAKHRARPLTLEPASESFSADGRRMAVLACLTQVEAAAPAPADADADAAPSPMDKRAPGVTVTATTSALVMAPADAAAAAQSDPAATPPADPLADARLVVLPAAVALQCRTADADAGGEATAAYRFTTRWQDDATVAIEREPADMEPMAADTVARRELMYLVNLKGEITKTPASVAAEGAGGGSGTAAGTWGAANGTARPAAGFAATAAARAAERGNARPSDGGDGPGRREPARAKPATRKPRSTPAPPRR